MCTGYASIVTFSYACLCCLDNNLFLCVVVMPQGGLEGGRQGGTHLPRLLTPRRSADLKGSAHACDPLIESYCHYIVILGRSYCNHVQRSCDSLGRSIFFTTWPRTRNQGLAGTQARIQARDPDPNSDRSRGSPRCQQLVKTEVPSIKI